MPLDSFALGGSELETELDAMRDRTRGSYAVRCQRIHTPFGRSELPTTPDLPEPPFSRWNDTIMLDNIGRNAQGYSPKGSNAAWPGPG